jgi:nucleoside 2-deoxyribosyltransferase
MGKKIYLASPFFNENELSVYFKVIQALRSKGYEVYVPQEHEIENAWDYPNYVWGQKVFDEDVKALGTCDVVMVLNFGMYSDSGTAWEAGFALGIGKECIQVLCGDDNTTYSLMMVNGTNKVIHLENVANWEEESAWYPLNKIIQK